MKNEKKIQHFILILAVTEIIHVKITVLCVATRGKNVEINIKKR